MARDMAKNAGRIAVGMCAFFVIVGIVLTMIGAWFTHVILCIQTSSWFLLVIGIFVPPIGWAHGIGSWLGYY
jgi:hypothetical protein